MQGITTQDNVEVEKLAMANCLTLLSQINNSTGSPSLTGRDFKCKTCSRQFPTFQALGGHRASHKKSKLSMVHSGANPKTHKCSICGVEFEKGQALGGHMRRHVSVMKVEDLKSSSSVVTTDPLPVPVFKKYSSSKRILCDDLDLDLDLKLGW